MTEETAVVETEAEVIAPVEEVTATTETEEATEPEAVEPVKEFTQKDIDDAVGKRLARERRKLEREKNSAPPAPVVTGDIDPSDVEALANKRADEILLQRDHQKVVLKFEEREDDFIDAHPDYDEKVTNNNKLPINENMAFVIKASEVGPDLAYHLADNPKEAARISKLPPLLQAKELGRIEATITAVPVKKQSKAPAPITPITPKSGGDQKPGNMSDNEYRAHSRKMRRSL